ncbi:methylenetetrahydrofolate dehydrogenase (NADP+) / methenyltetrahydrofolate cyclohydrolase [Anaerobranca californiensis DSM 14826]|uniref:Bifunctional protein FolD n=1 Tax=Anaerobranca californiensis DSM 14826 TaxID=1120989 RepID=A0A1M6L6Q6_9FIRM|nr:bifunctional methylenetetrahydrofolate dehydrogenase/methenyltetrahydrofolate cyclohydrolase FolD [Anaerobranca californiensis]SHJ66852.1 methylenetetrahydrofolate dehydrogenase (NADP+) / methenyltetrahydrofolate cyclohydrolase [Anaerobranca californiensis DSM 14826]
MAAALIDGKLIAQKVKDEIQKRVDNLKAKGITPGLGVILVGEDPASQAYVGMKEKTCKKLGIHSEVYRLDGNTSEKEVLDLLEKLNNDSNIHGILVQLPLPKHIDEWKVLDAIDPQKDVDGFHSINVGNLCIGRDAFVPCTPLGVIVMLEHCNVDLTGKHVVVVGRSNIVGKPMAQLALQRHATVTIAHSRTKDLAAITRQADVLIVAVGRPKMITKDMVKEGAVVIDVGINRVESGLVGDVDFDGVKEVASQITPVPGGVGPMTIAMLMHNTVLSAERRKNNV